MRPEDFTGKPTVNPNTKRIYAYGQMLFGALTATATVIASVYAFLGNYTTGAELTEAIDKNNIDLVPAGKALPHDARFKRLEDDLASFRERATTLERQRAELLKTDTETLEILAGYLAADSEPHAQLRAFRARETRETFKYYIEKGETPIGALRLAMRPPGTRLR